MQRAHDLASAIDGSVSALHGFYRDAGRFGDHDRLMGSVTLGIPASSTLFWRLDRPENVSIVSLFPFAAYASMRALSRASAE